jgi:endoglucanase
MLYRFQKPIWSAILPFVLLASACAAHAQSSIEIRRNQVGCSPAQEKVIVVEGMTPQGKLQVTTPSGKKVKPTAIRQAVSPWTGKQRYVVDLGQLTAPGRYHISIHTSSGSRQNRQQCDLVVAERPYQAIAKASLRLFYLIRSGVAIELGGDYNRPVGHPDTHVLVHPSAATERRPAGTVISSPYGWYDAGDYNKYVVNSAFSIGLMLAAYEQQRDYFTALTTDIPESGNQTPDLLDEMMFNLRWLLTMQDPDDGGVYHKLTTPNFEGFIMPTACRQPRYVVAKSVTASLDFAAVMADAARHLAPYQHDYPDFCQQATAAAERAYQWAKANPDAFYRQELLRDPAVSTGTYGDRNARDEFFWAASALYRLTRKPYYLDEARQTLPSRFSTPSWGNVAALGSFEWLAEGETADLYATQLTQLLAYCQSAVQDVDASCFQSPFGNKPRDFGWGCLAENCCCQALVLLLADKLQGTTAYRRYALQNADYLMGRNATGYCYVTGFGDKSPLHPHHRISAADAVEQPFPGMLVGGPNPAQQDRAAGNLTYPSSYPDESYLDVTESYASNEIAINWNASLVAFLCWLDALK